MTSLQTSQFLALEAVSNSENVIQVANFVRHTSYRVAVHYCELLHFCRDRVSEGEIREFLSGRFRLDESEQTEAIRVGVDHYFLVSPEDPIERASIIERDRWENYSWNEAFYLHTSTRNYEFLDYAGEGGQTTDFAMMEHYLAETGRPPSPTKSYPGPVLSLSKAWPQVPYPTNFQDLFEGGKDQIGARRPIHIDDLGAFLFFSVGKVGVVSFRAQGEFILKPVPSGGSRHPTEVYLLVLEVAGVPKGIYHYDVVAHGLRLIQPLDLNACIDQLLRTFVLDYGDRVSKRPAFVAFVAARVERAQWRYRDPRSHRAVLLDIGHVLGQFRIVASALRLSPFVSQGVREEPLERVLAIGRDEEIVTHAVFI